MSQELPEAGFCCHQSEHLALKYQTHPLSGPSLAWKEPGLWRWDYVSFPCIDRSSQAPNPQAQAVQGIDCLRSRPLQETSICTLIMRNQWGRGGWSPFFGWWGPEAMQIPMFSISMAEPWATLGVAGDKIAFLIMKDSWKKGKQGQGTPAVRGNHP